MVREAAPVVVCYDGSELSRTAVRHAADLFSGRPVVLATVWEPGLAMASSMAPTYDTAGVALIPPDPELTEAVDRSHHEHASSVAADGAELARSLGLAAEPHAVPDQRNVADTLIDLARARNAAVVVMGSHGISGLRSRLLGRVSRKLIEHCDRPVLVIRDESH
jgi:nucleotide-binding universal stress UspA family protein